MANWSIAPMVNFLVCLRRFLYRHYIIWGLLAFLFGLGVGLTPIFLSENKEHMPKVKFMPLGLLVHNIFCFAFVLCCGRWWGHRFFDFALHWGGKAAIQIFGMLCSGLIGWLAGRLKLTPLELLLYSLYSYCISEYMQFLVVFDITTAWMSTAAYAAWSKPHLKAQDYVIAALGTALLACLHLFRCFLREIAPDAQLEEEAKDRYIKACCGAAQPSRRAPPVAPQQLQALRLAQQELQQTRQQMAGLEQDLQQARRERQQSQDQLAQRATQSQEELQKVGQELEQLRRERQELNDELQSQYQLAQHAMQSHEELQKVRQELEQERRERQQLHLARQHSWEARQLVQQRIWQLAEEQQQWQPQQEDEQQVDTPSPYRNV